MRTTTMAALLLAAVAGHAAEPAATEGLTWQEANKRSAALIKEKGPSNEAADLARAAFDLYPQQTERYRALNHAQLLLNLAGARQQARGVAAALKEIDRGTAAITRKAGPETDVLIAVWQEAARIAGRGTDLAGRYNDQALARAERLLGPDDPHTITLLLDVVHDRRATEGYQWASMKYLTARERAAKSGEDSALVAEIDLQLAKLHVEDGRSGEAIAAYRALIERLEKRNAHDQEHLLRAAYAQLEHAYDEAGDEAAAAETRQRRSARSTGDDVLVPLVRPSPRYPRDAARMGRQGMVEFHLRVGPDGSVLDAEVVRSEPPGVFDQSALAAIRKWKFQPKVVNGQAVESSGHQKIEYRLLDEKQFRRGSN